ncbi:hypothetical protein [uncultured Desulfobacter sp.]|uniref:head-tail joining protein n=1 Tax=uncultured Desulfobacter sp. TaxID=240139 RepID=UPI0029F4DC27|nr:hypothetical protein [uncultured Desulfobacter sp.]
MTSFADDMAQDLEEVFFNTDEFSVEVVYTPKATGVPVPITVNVDYGEIENSRGKQSDGLEHMLTCERDSRSGFGGQFSRSVATVWVKVSNIAEPAVYDEIEIDGAVYRVLEMFDHV